MQKASWLSSISEQKSRTRLFHLHGCNISLILCVYIIQVQLKFNLLSCIPSLHRKSLRLSNWFLNTQVHITSDAEILPFKFSACSTEEAELLIFFLWTNILQLSKRLGHHPNSIILSLIFTEDLPWGAYRHVKKKYMHTSQSNDCWQFFRLYCYCNFKCIHFKFSHGTCSLLQDAALCTLQTLCCHLAVCWQKQNYTSDMQ